MLHCHLSETKCCRETDSVMVSADNLNLDVLELVFAHLVSGNDLTSVALVSRSFFAGVIPKLYERITFRLREAKKYPLVCLLCIFICESYL